MPSINIARCETISVDGDPSAILRGLASVASTAACSRPAISPGRPDRRGRATRSLLASAIQAVASYRRIVRFQPSGQQAPVSISILMAEMTLLRLLALRLGQELARRPEARAKAKEALVKTQRLVNEELKPRAQQAWREAQPEIETAKRRLKSFAEELRAKYRKG